MKRVALKPIGKNTSGLRPFKKGDRRLPNAGRKKGVPNKLTMQIKQAIAEAAEYVGQDGDGYMGALGYFAWLARREPQVYGRLVEKILPSLFQGTIGGNMSASGKYETLAELAEALKQRGLPPPSKLIDITPKKKAHDEEDDDFT